MYLCYLLTVQTKIAIVGESFPSGRSSYCNGDNISNWQHTVFHFQRAFREAWDLWSRDVEMPRFQNRGLFLGATGREPRTTFEHMATEGWLSLHVGIYVMSSQLGTVLLCFCSGTMKALHVCLELFVKCRYYT